MLKQKQIVGGGGFVENANCLTDFLFPCVSLGVSTSIESIDDAAARKDSFYSYMITPLAGS